MKKVLSILALPLVWGTMIFAMVRYDGHRTPPTSPAIQEEAPDIPETPGDYVKQRGYDDCTQDCSGHEAGYQWAEDHDVCDPNFDGGNSESFREGVIAYAYDSCYYSDDDGPI